MNMCVCVCVCVVCVAPRCWDLASNFVFVGVCECPSFHGAQVVLRKMDVCPSIYKSVSVFVFLCESVCSWICLFVASVGFTD